jgi:hypothetical protein
MAKKLIPKLHYMLCIVKALYSLKTELKLMYRPGPQLALSYLQRPPIGRHKIEPVEQRPKFNRAANRIVSGGYFLYPASAYECREFTSAHVLTTSWG